MLALDGARNFAGLASSVVMTAADRSVAAVGIRATAVGAVGGGPVRVGDATADLDRSVASVIGRSDPPRRGARAPRRLSPLRTRHSGTRS